MVKAFNLPIDYVLYHMSYANIVLYSAALPHYQNKTKDDSRKGGKAISADDPNNQSKVLSFLNSVD